MTLAEDIEGVLTDAGKALTIREIMNTLGGATYGHTTTVLFTMRKARRVTAGYIVTHDKHGRSARKMTYEIGDAR